MTEEETRAVMVEMKLKDHNFCGTEILVYRSDLYASLDKAREADAVSTQCDIDSAVDLFDAIDHLWLVERLFEPALPITVLIADNLGYVLPYSEALNLTSEFHTYD